MNTSNGKGKGNGNISVSDLRLWKEVMRDVDPLDEIDWVEQESGLEDYTTEEKPKEQREKAQAVAEPAKPKKRKDPRSSSQLDRRTETRLRKGQLPIEGTLDLHGLNQDQAKAALIDFLEKAAENGKRCVLVITGKGKSQKAEDKDWFTPRPGILRQLVPEWLRVKPLSEIVLKSYVAKHKDGGEGALYVYLRRKRPD